MQSFRLCSCSKAEQEVGWVLGELQLGRHGYNPNSEHTATLAIFWSVVKMMMVVVVMVVWVLFPTVSSIRYSRGPSFLPFSVILSKRPP